MEVLLYNTVKVKIIFIDLKNGLVFFWISLFFFV